MACRYCLFCQTHGHDVLDCPNIDPEQHAIELARRIVDATQRNVPHIYMDERCQCADCLQHPEHKPTRAERLKSDRDQRRAAGKSGRS